MISLFRFLVLEMALPFKGPNGCVICVKDANACFFERLPQSSFCRFSLGDSENSAKTASSKGVFLVGKPNLERVLQSEHISELLGLPFMTTLCYVQLNGRFGLDFSRFFT